MKKIMPAFLAIICLVSIAAAMPKGDEKKTYSWRYRMTVEVDTPEGLVMGSSVFTVDLTFSPSDPKRTRYSSHAELNGQSVILDFGNKGKVFSTIRVSDSYLPHYAFSGPPIRTLKGAEYYSQLKGMAALAPDYYPMFVRFTDIHDPLSVQLVRGNHATDGKNKPPYVFQDNFSKIFGEGVRLKKIYIAMTDEDASTGILEVLPLLKKIKYGHLDGNRIGTIKAENRLANRLSVGSFTANRSP